MIKKVLVIIPARVGSKKLPRKNIIKLSGKPLISWTIEASLKSKYHCFNFWIFYSNIAITIGKNGEPVFEGMNISISHIKLNEIELSAAVAQKIVNFDIN